MNSWKNGANFEQRDYILETKNLYETKKYI